MVADWAPGVRTIAKRVLFHSMTALTGWAEFCSWSVAAFASGATCKKAQINANVAKILNICLYLRLLFVRTPVLRLAYLQTRNRVRYSLDCDKNSKSLAGRQLGISQPDIWPVHNPVSARVDPEQLKMCSADSALCIVGFLA